MAQLIPDFLEKKLKKILQNAPEPLRYLLCVTYWQFLKTCYQLWVWYQYNRHHEAPVKPFKIMSVDPRIINHYSKRDGHKLYPLIREGDWDKQRSPFENGSVYNSFYDHFVLGKQWSETDRYQYYIQTYGNKDEVFKQSYKLRESFKMFDNVETIEEAFRKYDYIYESIKTNGYQRQRDVTTLKDRLECPGLPSSAFPEADEVTVDIGRNGTMMCYSGQHRLAIAKILQLDSIPIRVRLRHRQWQNERDSVWRGDKPSKDHPDLQPPK